MQQQKSIIRLFVLSSFFGFSACSDPWVTVHLTGSWIAPLHVNVIYEDGDHEAGTPFDVVPKDGVFSFHIPRDKGKIKLRITNLQDSEDGKHKNCRALAIEQEIDLNGSRFGQDIELEYQKPILLNPLRCECVKGWCQVFPPAGSPSVDWNSIGWSTVWGNGSDVWIAGSSLNLLRWKGSAWETGTSQSNRNLALWGYAAEVRLVTGEGDILQLQAGNGFMRELMGGSVYELHGIWGQADDSAVAVGGSNSQGKVRAKSDNWGFMGDPNGVLGHKLKGVWASSPDRVWAVGDGGAIISWKGVDRNKDEDFPIASPSDNQLGLNAIWGSSYNNIWAFGSNGVVLHGNGNVDGWKTEESPTTTNINAVWGSSESDVWAVGEKGLILHFNGTKWALEPSPIDSSKPTTLRGVWGTGRETVWIVGDSGTILFRDP